MSYRIHRLKWGRRMAGPLIFVAFVLFAFLVVSTGPNAAPAEPVERVWPVSVLTAQPAALHPVHRAWGRLESAETADIRSRVTASVARVAVSEGDWVEAGEVLVELEREDLTLRCREARADRDRAAAALASVRGEQVLVRELAVHHETMDRIARERLQRFRVLHEDRMISDAQLDEMRQQAEEQSMRRAEHRARVNDMPNLIARHEAELDRAESRLEQARRDLRHASIVAPFSGRVLGIQVARGDRALGGDVLARVADYGQLRVRASLPGDVAGRLRQAVSRDEEVTAMVAMNGKTHPFTLDRLSASVRDGQSGVDSFFRAPADPGLVIGELYGLEIDLPARDRVVALPVHALYEGDRIYRVQDGRLQAIEVQRVGDWQDEAGRYRVLVTSQDIHHGDALMTTRLPVAISGLRVEPVNDVDTASPVVRQLAIN
ncbi:MAG: efflux RND transporter periplasmic adaptor subunit [Pseudomonadota bacterium]